MIGVFDISCKTGRVLRVVNPSQCRRAKWRGSHHSPIQAVGRGAKQPQLRELFQNKGGVAIRPLASVGAGQLFRLKLLNFKGFSDWRNPVCLKVSVAFGRFKKNDARLR